CIVNAFAAKGCDGTDLKACLCVDIALQADLSECVQTTCPFADQVVAGKIETEICDGFPKESRSWEVIGVTTAGCVIVFPIVMLRLYSRTHYATGLSGDDFATIAAAVGDSPLDYVTTLTERRFFSQYLRLSICITRGSALLFYFNTIVYMVLLVVGKMAILLVYLRIFPGSTFRHITYALIGFLAVHGVIYALLTTLQCIPIDSIWDRLITDRRCLDVNAVVYSSGILSILEDIVILILPMKQVWQLNIRRHRRIVLVGLFSVGSFACLTSMIRMKYAVAYSTTFDATWDGVDIVVWSAVEQFCALLCGSFPALRPLFVDVLARSQSSTSNELVCVQAQRQSAGSKTPVSSGGPMQQSHSDATMHAHRPTPAPDAILVTSTVSVRAQSGTWLEEGSESDGHGLPDEGRNVARHTPIVEARCEALP
ncbi:hypothetical protein Micbo1qcDRAFT_129033, partial [Microdochium bolleyi]